MNIKKQFIYNPEVEVSACQIGISKWDWISTKSADEKNAIEIMKNTPGWRERHAREHKQKQLYSKL